MTRCLSVCKQTRTKVLHTWSLFRFSLWTLSCYLSCSVLLWWHERPHLRSLLIFAWNNLLNTIDLIKHGEWVRWSRDACILGNTNSSQPRAPTHGSYLQWWSSSRRDGENSYERQGDFKSKIGGWKEEWWGGRCLMVSSGMLSLWRALLSSKRLRVFFNCFYSNACLFREFILCNSVKQTF